MTYTLPSDRMAEAARLLMTEPSTYIPALVEALRAVKGQGPAAVVAQHIYEQVNK